LEGAQLCGEKHNECRLVFRFWFSRAFWRGAAAPLCIGARGNPDFHTGYPLNFFAFFITMVSSHGILKVFPCTDGMHNLK
jgi:hypothetical protein